MPIMQNRNHPFIHAVAQTLEQFLLDDCALSVDRDLNNYIACYASQLRLRNLQVWENVRQRGLDLIAAGFAIITGAEF